jgi:hypothetical protein
MFRGPVFRETLTSTVEQFYTMSIQVKKRKYKCQSTNQFVHSINIADRLESFQDDVVSEMRCKIQCIDDDMRRIVRSQTTVEDEATR